MPPRPNFEELCEQSDLVVCGKLLNSAKENSRSRLNYAEHRFEICEYYLGEKKSGEITVLIPMCNNDRNYVHTRQTCDCSRTAVYEAGEKYFLFLRKYKKDIYIRTPLEDVWEEQAYDPRESQVIRDESAAINQSDRWLVSEDNLTYRIPSDAVEYEQLLSHNENQRYSKKIAYEKNGYLVGEKGWYKNGTLAYIAPHKNNLLHGIRIGWSENGFLAEVVYYRKGRYHGYVMRWDNDDRMNLSFWIRGRYVSLKKYLKECQRNVTLPSLAVKI